MIPAAKTMHGRGRLPYPGKNIFIGPFLYFYGKQCVKKQPPPFRPLTKACFLVMQRK